MKMNVIAAGRLAVCAMLAVSACACRRQAGPPQRPPAAVQTAPAVKMDVPLIIAAFGTTEDRASVDIVPQVSGILLKTFIADGATVTNGQPLFQIDPSDYVARVRQVEGMVMADRANLALSRSTLDRNVPLSDKQMISSNSLDVLKAKVDAVAGQLQMDEALLEQARLSLARCTIVAPMAGICSKRYVNDGNLVAAGQSRLTNIRSYDPINVDFSVSEQHLPAIRQALGKGAVRIEVTPRGETNAYIGTLVFMDNAVSSQTGSILLRGQVPNSELKLWSRQFVDIRVIAGTLREVVMIPEGAVQFGKQGHYLFAVSADNKAEMRIVRTGVRYNNLIQVLDGVAAGERVVVLGQLMLYPGAAVREAVPGGGPTGAAPEAGGSGSKRP
jgi:multidrug efflux system membrane fusion protein